jgi:hypothetical protein
VKLARMSAPQRKPAVSPAAAAALVVKAAQQLSDIPR